MTPGRYKLYRALRLLVVVYYLHKAKKNLLGPRYIPRRALVPAIEEALARANDELLLLLTELGWKPTEERYSVENPEIVNLYLVCLQRALDRHKGSDEYNEPFEYQIPERLLKDPLFNRLEFEVAVDTYARVYSRTGPVHPLIFECDEDEKFWMSVGGTPEEGWKLVLTWNSGV